MFAVTDRTHEFFFFCQFIGELVFTLKSNVLIFVTKFSTEAVC